MGSLKGLALNLAHLSLPQIPLGKASPVAKLKVKEGGRIQVRSKGVHARGSEELEPLIQCSTKSEIIFPKAHLL